jgi:putative mRNA 3-end processing factor
VRAEGLYCAAGDFFVDPLRPVPRAMITHAHSDHARAGHGAVLATAETLALMQTRMGAALEGTALQALAPGETVTLNGARVRLHPAGHVLGSAQVAIEHGGGRAVVSGDYKRAADPTCAAFEPVACDVFITEATFGLPVFTHPPAAQEAAKLLESVRLFPERAHLVGCYALGKTQRLIAVLRGLGYDAPIYLHGALIPVCETYERLGVRLGALLPATGTAQAEMAGRIVLAPPSALADRWQRRLPDPVTALASGWMRVRQRAKARGVELPLVISDHADWPELLATFDDVGAPEVWVTHGEETALIHAAEQRGLVGRALRLIGYGEAAEEEAA